MTPASQLAPIDRFRRLPRRLRAEVYVALRRLGSGALASQRYKWRGWMARPDQLVEQAELRGKDTVVFRGVRRVGKTEAAIQFMLEEIFAGRAKTPRMFGTIDSDLSMLAKRIQESLPKHLRPEWSSGSRDGPAGILRFPNDVEVPCFAAASPEAVVGWEGDFFYLDDIAKWKHWTETAWFHARTACSKGRGIVVVATTKRGRRVLRDLTKGAHENVLVKRPPSARANDANLQAGYRDRRAGDLADSELYDDDLGDDDVEEHESPFAEFPFRDHRLETIPRLLLLGVAIDVATSSVQHSCEVGIVGGGLAEMSKVVITDDRSAVLNADVGGWPSVAWDLAEELQARHPGVPFRFVVETNKGGNQPAALLRAEERRRRLERGKPGVSTVEIHEINAGKSKTQRAQEPARIGKGGQLKFSAVAVDPKTGKKGPMHVLERQLAELRDEGGKSDRADAAVHLVTDLADLKTQDEDGGDQFAMARAMNEALSGKAKPKLLPDGSLEPMKVEGAPPGDARHAGPPPRAVGRPTWQSRRAF